MKSCTHLLAALIFALTAMACGATVPCRTLKPDPAAFAMRASFARALSSPLLRRSVKAETRLDVIDVLVAYDLSAQRWLADNDKGTPLEYARRKVGEMNECLESSRIDKLKFRLVGVVCIGDDAARYRDRLGFVDFDTILSGKLVNEWGDVVASGEWMKIVDCRETCGADVVSLLVDAGQYGTVGLGYALEDDYVNKFSQEPELIPLFGDWAYSVCSIRAADEGYSMLHEIGHNMGCGHPDKSCASPSEMDVGPQLFTSSSGYYAWIGGEGYYTIMGYNFGGLRPDGSYDPRDRFIALPCFSSPLLAHDGVPIGTARNNNRSTILATYAYVAQYRASTLPTDADPEDYSDSSPSRVFPTEFRPANAIKGTPPYVGAVYVGGKEFAILSLQCGKVAVNGKMAGTSKVTAVVTELDGKQKKSSTGYVKCGYDAKVTLVVKDWGTLSITLGGEGFTGTIGDNLTVKTADVGGALPNANFAVDVDFNAGTAVLPVGVLDNLLPTGDNAEPFRSSGGKWTFAKPAAIKYKKVTDRTTREVHYELQGTDDPVKTNLSAMKLTYAPKKGTFKGTCKVYALEPAGAKSKLKKYSVKVSGIVVDGVGRGAAEIGKSGNFPVTVAPQGGIGK